MANDPRAEELYKLRLALATFALHLDAFEARLKSRSSVTSSEASQPTPSDTGFASKIVSAMKSADTAGRDPKPD
jgi:hypothetical protein